MPSVNCDKPNLGTHSKALSNGKVLRFCAEPSKKSQTVVSQKFPEYLCFVKGRTRELQHFRAASVLPVVVYSPYQGIGYRSIEPADGCPMEKIFPSNPVTGSIHHVGSIDDDNEYNKFCEK